MNLCKLPFQHGIMPELVGKYFSNMSLEVNKTEAVAEDHSYEQSVRIF